MQLQDAVKKRHLSVTQTAWDLLFRAAWEDRDTRWEMSDVHGALQVSRPSLSHVKASHWFGGRTEAI